MEKIRDKIEIEDRVDVVEVNNAAKIAIGAAVISTVAALYVSSYVRMKLFKGQWQVK